MTEYIRGLLNAYVIMDGTGVVISLIILYFLSKKIPEPKRTVYGVHICSLVGLFLGAHILYLIIHIPQVISGLSETPAKSLLDLIARLYNVSSGLSIFGGFFGAICAVIIICKIFKLKPRIYLNILYIFLPLYQFFGRIACSLAGCCYGVEYHGPLAINYSADYIVAGASDDIAECSRFPIQPLEGFFGLLLFIFMLILFLKYKDKFAFTPIFLFIYSVIRFFDDFLRADKIRGVIGPVSASQCIAIIVIFITSIYFIQRRRGNNYGEE